MTQFKERRQHVRKMGDGLAVLIDGKVFPVSDISISGVSFQGSGHKLGDRIRLSVVALRALEDKVEATVTIKVVNGGIIRGEFAPTTKLMRFIISHLGEVTGSQPAYFR
jgi:hypothetical protein